MATKNTDYTAFVKDMMNAFPVDTKAFDGQYKSAAELNEKLAHVAIDAAGRSTELSTKYTKDMLGRVSELSKAKAEPADYAKAISDFAQAQMDVTTDQLTAYADIVKDAQTRTVELMMNAGREFSTEAAKTSKAAANKATAAAERATAAK